MAKPMPRQRGGLARDRNRIARARQERNLIKGVSVRITNPLRLFQVDLDRPQME
jgi:hypothetical protein